MLIFCAICRKYCVKNKLSVIKCGHVFHSKCLRRWLEGNRNCPQCREAVRDDFPKRLYVDAGPRDATEKPSGSSENDVSAMKNKVEALSKDLEEQKTETFAAKKLLAESKIEVERLKQYEQYEKLIKEGSDELTSSWAPANGEKHWRDLACVYKRRLSLANFTIRDLKFSKRFLTRKSTLKLNMENKNFVNGRTSAAVSSFPKSELLRSTTEICSKIITRSQVRNILDDTAEELPAFP